MPLNLILKPHQAYKTFIQASELLLKKEKERKKKGAGAAKKENDEPLVIFTTYAEKIEKKKDEKSGDIQCEIICYKEDDKILCFAFSSQKQLGEVGAQGIVFFGQQLFGDANKNADMNNRVVLKMSAPVDQHVPDTTSTEDFNNEKLILQHIKRYRGYVRVKNEGLEAHYLFSQFCPGTNLLDILYKKVECKNTDRDMYPYLFSYEKITLNKFKKICLIRAIIESVASFHQEYSLLHSDLKTANIIIDDSDDSQSLLAYLIDFGTSCFMALADKLFKGSTAYQGPEADETDQIKRPVSHYQTDYYSLGIIILEILSENNYQEFLRDHLAQWNSKGHSQKRPDDFMQRAFSDLFAMQEPPKDAHEDDRVIWSIVKFAKKLIQDNRNLRPTAPDFNQFRANFNKRFQTVFDFHQSVPDLTLRLAQLQISEVPTPSHPPSPTKSSPPLLTQSKHSPSPTPRSEQLQAWVRRVSSSSQGLPLEALERKPIERSPSPSPRSEDLQIRLRKISQGSSSGEPSPQSKDREPSRGRSRPEIPPLITPEPAGRGSPRSPQGSSGGRIRISNPPKTPPGKHSTTSAVSDVAQPTDAAEIAHMYRSRTRSVSAAPASAASNSDAVTEELKQKLQMKNDKFKKTH